VHLPVLLRWHLPSLLVLENTIAVRVIAELSKVQVFGGEKQICYGIVGLDEVIAMVAWRFEASGGMIVGSWWLCGGDEIKAAVQWLWSRSRSE